MLILHFISDDLFLSRNGNARNVPFVFIEKLQQKLGRLGGPMSFLNSKEGHRSEDAPLFIA
jgi:hypothetical protein